MSATPSQKESQLLDISKAYDEAYATGKTDKLEKFLKDDVVLKKDTITLKEDLKGKDAVKQYIAAYAEKYSFSHESIAGGVDEQQNVTFSFWQDKGVKLKSGGASSDTVGIHHLMLDDGLKIKEIAFNRQLSKDEEESKVKNPPSQQTNFSAESYKGSGSAEPSRERMAKMMEATRKFNDIWAKGDSSLADGIMVEDVRQYNPLLGQTINSRDDFKKMIDTFSKEWDIKSNHSHTAASAGNKSFVHWDSDATHTKDNTTESMYGLNMLVFNDEGKIAEVIGFRQPSKSELQQFLK